MQWVFVYWLFGGLDIGQGGISFARWFPTWPGDLGRLVTDVNVLGWLL